LLHLIVSRSLRSLANDEIQWEESTDHISPSKTYVLWILWKFSTDNNWKNKWTKISKPPIRF